MSSDPGNNPKKSKTVLVFKILLLNLLLFGTAGAIASYVFLQPPPLRQASQTFLVEPYLQVGHQNDLTAPEVVWASFETKGDWKLQWKDAGGNVHLVKPVEHDVHLDDMPPFKMFETTLANLPLNIAIPYEVAHDDQKVFRAEINPLRTTATKYRFDVVGDIASGGAAQRQVAVAMFKSKPDVLMVAGDIVYPFGRALDYLDHFFPIYNADSLTSQAAPMLRSTLWVAAPGNHDVASSGPIDIKNLNRFPDALAYFLFWRQPLNGPVPAVDEKKNIPLAEGSLARRDAFLQAAGTSYPRESNFSLNFGNSHWLVLDGDPYMDWTDAKLQQWVDDDLTQAQSATWKFVLFHQADFNSDYAHFHEQRMRLLSDIFQKHNVDIVFAGHTHSYQRTYPLTFHLKKQPDGSPIAKNGTVDGSFDFDKKFDGVKNTVAHGVIHIITGCGGAALTGGVLVGHPEKWQPFTTTLMSKYSFTQCDVDGKRLIISQMGADGTELDHLELTK